ncbi:MAG: transcriptional regulator [Candidatus Pacebacteria bacterium CG10_big_fil_rev_8_21_14_0_10_44_11]|nr:MAG: transcriptional regulator [Candidatus Pacebacteria bacterium CG10_big_fil_rev_8_21_14_0_10_44_11]
MPRKIQSPFSKQTYQRNARFYKVMANAKRLEILNLLARHELTVSQLVKIMGLKKANISQHLAILLELNTVKVHRSGKNAFYSITNKKIVTPCKILNRLWEQQSAKEIPQ